MGSRTCMVSGEAGGASPQGVAGGKLAQLSTPWGNYVSISCTALQCMSPTVLISVTYVCDYIVL